VNSVKLTVAEDVPMPEEIFNNNSRVPETKI